MNTENGKFKKGDIVNYRFPTYSGIGIVKLKRGPGIWDVLVEGESSDVRCFKENIDQLDPPLNVFDLIRELWKRKERK